MYCQLDVAFSRICSKVSTSLLDYHSSYLLGGMVESKNSEIVIQDVEPSSFKGTENLLSLILYTLLAVLDYIYSNKVELTQNLACDLLKLADKWSFLPLKNECEAFLSQHLTQENFKDIAAITKQVEAPNLENAIIEFVVKNVKVTKETRALTGLPKQLYVKIIANILKIELH